MFAALLTTGLFALTAVFATQAALLVGAIRANLGRLVIATVLLGAWAHAFGRGLGGGELPVFFLAGAIGFGAGGFCMFQAFPRIGSTLSLLVVECAATLVTAVMGWIVFSAHLTPAQILSALLCIGGVVTALYPYRMPDVPRRTLLAGVGFTLAAAFFQGISWTLTKHAFLEIARAGGAMDPMNAAYQRLLGGLTVAVVIYAMRYLRKADQRVQPSPAAGRSWRAAGWILANALAGPVLGVSCMLWAIREVANPGLVQAVVATATLVTVPLARHLERRVFRWPYFLGAAIAIAGVAGLLLSTS